MLRRSDRSYYIGSTSYKDVLMRVAEHNDAKYIGYTAVRRPVALIWAQWFDDLREAHAKERQLKGWSRAKKEALIAGDVTELKLSARRRGGNAISRPRTTKRQVSTEFQATGARHPEARSRAQRGSATKDE
jgi:putative endonuclease